MKKFLKSISVICLMLVMALPITLLAGCTKNYTINVSIASGSEYGQVLANQEEGRSILGKNTVEEGTKFEYLVKAKENCEIESIVVDGKAIEITNKVAMYPVFEEVTGSHTVVVKFKRATVVVNLFAKNDEDQTVLWKTIQVEYQSTLDFNAAEFGVPNNKDWKKGDGTYLYNNSKDANAEIPSGYKSNKVTIRGEMSFYTDKKVSELPA